MKVAQESLNEVNDDAELLKCVITDDETWVYVYDVETKAQSYIIYQQVFIFLQDDYPIVFSLWCRLKDVFNSIDEFFS